MKKPKKILYVEQNTDGTIGGSYYSLFYLVTSIDKNRFCPIVIFYRENELIPRFIQKGIDVRVLKKIESIKFISLENTHSGFLKKLLLPILLVQKVLNIFLTFLFPAFLRIIYLVINGIKIVHLNNSILYNHDWMLASFLTRKKCITHERGINNHFPSTARFFGKNLFRIICISDAVKTNMQERGVNFPNMERIYNGFDPANIKTNNSVADVKAEFTITDNPVIGVIGNIKEWKGQDVIIKAVINLIDKYRNLKCLLVGDTAEMDMYFKNQLTELIRRNGVEQNIIFTGYQKNVYDYLNAFDVAIHTSVLPEPFGRVLLESMALKKPVIGSADGAVPEIIINNETGLTFTPGDSKMLANKIDYLLSHPGKMKEMGEAGYKRLMKEFHISLNIERTENLY